MFFYFSIVLYVLALAYFIKLIVNFISCRGKEPPFICSFGKIKKEILEEARIFLRENSGIKVTDLGCGSGSLLIPLAKEFKMSKFVGYEYDWIAYSIAKIRTFYIPNIVIYKKNFFEADLKEYKLVLCYITPGIADLLGDKLNKDLAKDTLIISEIFEIPKLKKIKEVMSAIAFKKLKIFLYNPNK